MFLFLDFLPENTHLQDFIDEKFGYLVVKELAQGQVVRKNQA